MAQVNPDTDIDVSITCEPIDIHRATVAAAEGFGFASHILLQEALHGRSEGSYGRDDLIEGLASDFRFVVGAALEDAEQTTSGGYVEILAALDVFSAWIADRNAAAATAWLAAHAREVNP